MIGNKNKLGGSFAWLNATQFLGAINDNVFKVAIILSLTPAEDPASATKIRAIAGAVFVVPFLLFSAFAGTVADRFSKRKVVIAVKIAEILIMAGGVMAFCFDDNTMLLYALLFVMAAQSTFFAPAKYGIIPELVSRDKLSKANSLIEAFTYLAIIIGTASTPFLIHKFGDRYSPVAVICVVVAVVGFIVSLPIIRTPPAGGHTRASVFFVRDIWRTISVVRKDRELIMAVVGAAYFMFFGGFLYVNLGPFGMDQLELDKVHSEYLFFAAAVGIGVGSYLAGKLSGRNIEFGIVPIGASGLAISSLCLGLMGQSVHMAVAIIFVMGLSGGLFIIPMHAFVQFKSPNDKRGEVLAASNWLGWLGVLIASIVVPVLSKYLSMSPANLFVVLSILMLALSVMTMVLLPDFLIRFAVLLVTKICYRIKIYGGENIPLDGPALLVSNHVSWVDAMLVGVTQQRRVRFLMDREMSDSRYFKWFFKLMRVIPISSSDPPKKIVASLREARAAMDEGYLVCVFAEGTISRNGIMREFRPGFERIVKGSDYPIIPVYLGGVWGSVFSYYYEKIFSVVPKIPYPISIHFGKAMPTESSADEIRLRMLEMSSDHFDCRKDSRGSLSENFVRTARRNWSRRCIEDVTGKRLTYGETLVGTLALASEIETRTVGQDKVGICLPPSAGGALANLAVSMLGKVPVNLNYVANESARKLAIEQCDIKCVISSSAFVDKVEGLKAIDGLVYLEDIIAWIKPEVKRNAWLKARFMPRRILTKAKNFKGDDVATIIFSSGSTGTPKGVMLTHHNILSNTESIRMVIQVKPNDDMCVVLPFFHSFGFTCGLWLPLVSGISASFIPNPLDGVAVAKMVRENKSTILFAPPTFLLAYLRRAKREDFASLRLAAVGAEKLKQKLADSYAERFGITLLEGYGATELSPVASLNVADVSRGGVDQVGNKPGTVGAPLPGVAVKIVDPDTQQVMPVGSSGLILVKGPNVMLGYLNMEEKTAEVLKDGWYNTGDIGCIDKDGFLSITDRLARFSKVGGEMVPHFGIEDEYHKGLNAHEQLVAVIGVPDDKKGEELIVLYLDKAGDPGKLNEIISKSEIPNMWKPRKDNYVKIDEMPVLGSGKLDMMKLRQIANKAKNGPDKVE